jgi:hypothetical protein
MIKSFEQFNKVCESTQIKENTDKFEQTFGKQLRDIKIAASRKERFSKVITCPEWSEPDIDMAFKIEFEWLPDFEVYYCTISNIREGKVVNSNINDFNTNGLGNAGTERGYVGNAKALVRILEQLFRSWWHGDMSDDELNREYDDNDSWHYSQEEF